MNGCPLDLAFNTQSINIDRKKKKKTKNIVYPNEIKDYHSANIMTNNELRSANEFWENKFVTTKSDYSKLTPYDTPVKYSQVNDNKDDNFVKISNEEYQKYKEYQQKRFNSNYENYENYENNNISVINDNFNDTILFGLYGILFLFLIDNIYKLGKKSY